MNLSRLLSRAALLSSVGAACALAPTAASASSPDLQKIAAAGFRGPIPTAAHPILDAKRIAEMRREGKLPDRFVRGRCEYDLAGDPGAAYYVKTCH